MRLYEFVNTNTLVTKLVAVADQLRYELDEKKADPNMSVDQFISYMQKYDITLDKMDLYNMIKKPPLNGLISNIQGDKIIFKNFAPEKAPDEEQNATVKAMAKKAAANLK